MILIGKHQPNTQVVARCTSAYRQLSGIVHTAKHLGQPPFERTLAYFVAPIVKTSHEYILLSYSQRSRGAPNLPTIPPTESDEFRTELSRFSRPALIRTHTTLPTIRPCILNPPRRTLSNPLSTSIPPRLTPPCDDFHSHTPSFPIPRLTTTTHEQHNSICGDTPRPAPPTAINIRDTEIPDNTSVDRHGTPDTSPFPVYDTAPFRPIIL